MSGDDAEKLRERLEALEAVTKALQEEHSELRTTIDGDLSALLAKFYSLLDADCE
jgi:hypothetical protein